jgi:group I intron endonuclease
MRIFKSHPLLKLVNSYLIDSPQPSNISYLWNFGSLLAVCLVIQIITGVTLAMHYNPSVLEAFNSVEHIMRDVNNGWLIRYLHSNTAAAFFFLVYLHIGRGLYYGSYRAPRTLVWTLGTVIFLLMMATAFLGLIHSPKWFKLSNNNNNNKYNNNNNKHNNNKHNNNNNFKYYAFSNCILDSAPSSPIYPASRRQFSTSIINRTKGGDTSRWSESTPTENTNSAIDKYKGKLAQDLKDRSGHADGTEETYDNAEKKFLKCKSIEEIDKVSEELVQEEKSKHAKIKEELSEDWGRMDDKIISSKIMDTRGQGRTSEDIWQKNQDTIQEYNELMVRNIKAINEARVGTIRRNFDFDHDSDDMSSVASFGSDSSDLKKAEVKKAEVKTEKDGDPSIPSSNAFSILDKEEYRKIWFLNLFPNNDNTESDEDYLLALALICIPFVLIIIVICLYNIYINKNKKSVFSSINKDKLLINKNRVKTKVKIKQINKITKRNFYTSSRKAFNENFPVKSLSPEVSQFLEDKNIKPVFVYDDLSNIATTRTIVLNETRDLSGIYLILNKFTLDYYIGSASTGKFHARFTNHLIYFKGSKVIKNAVKKYGISSFSFIILELFADIITKENNKKLLDLEDFYLKTLLPNYNILTEAGSSFGYKHSEITRIKMKATYSEERRIAIGNLNRGKSLSPSTIERMKQGALTRIEPKYTAKVIRNMKKNSKPILVYNFDYTVYGEFPSMAEAAKYLGCDQKTIRRALQTPKKILRKRWIVKDV